ncbi:MAG: hypothetical protein IT158_25925 [Bryobacterales bacterium]|nr:hypothetical protein [Bryobacterales bacterium]
MAKLVRACWVIGFLAAAVLAIVLVRQARVTREQTARVEQLSAENQALRAQLQKAAEEIETLRETHPGLLPPPVAGAADPSELDALRKRTEADAQAIRQLKDELTAAAANSGRLESRLAELEAELQRVSEENQRRSASQADLGEKIAGLNRIINAQETELKSRTGRIVQLELAIRKLREENQKSSLKSQQSSRLISELQDIRRRRDAHLASVLNRYREMAEQFRDVSGALESRQRQEGGAPGGADVARIQNTITLAEEDLRQLNSLQAQELRVQKQILEQ